MKHGLRADTIVIPGENPPEFEALHESLRADWHPKGAAEDLLVERVAICWWRLQRAVKFEAATMHYYHLAFEADRAEERVRALMPLLWDRPRGTEGKEPSQTRDPERDKAYALAREEMNVKKAQLEEPIPTLALAFEEAAPALQLVLRYDADARRSWESAVRDLQSLQSAREAKSPKLVDVIDVNLERDQSPAKAEAPPDKSRPRLADKQAKTNWGSG